MMKMTRTGVRFTALLLGVALLFSAKADAPVTEIGIGWWAKYLAVQSHGSAPYAVTGDFNLSTSKLHFTFKNVSNKSIGLYPSEFPWGSPNSLTLFAITDNGHLLAQSIPIADFPGETLIDLQPGRTKMGDVDLHYLAGFTEAHRRSSMILIWVYKLWNSTAGEPYPSVTGAIGIPKQDNP